MALNGFTALSFKISMLSSPQPYFIGEHQYMQNSYKKA